MSSTTASFALTRPYAGPVYASSLWQLSNTLVLYAGTLALMFASLEWHYGITLVLSIVAAAAYVRLFMIGHDCGHESFMPRAWENKVVGNLMGILTNTPFGYWAKQHALHHRGNGNLDKRGDGDVHLMTVNEYEAASLFRRFCYRVYRTPFFLFCIAAPLHFVVLQRWPLGHQAKTAAGWASTFGTNLAIVAYYAAIIAAFGWRDFLLVFGPVVFLSSLIAVWLFYVQHQFPGGYFRRAGDWAFQDAAVSGSSFYDLPPILHWACANIGFHHIHHLNPRIPNYRLPRCHGANSEFGQATALGLRASLGAARLALWCEEREEFVSFARLRRVRRLASPSTAP